MGENIDPGGENDVDASSVLWMGENRPALRMRNIHRGLGNGGVHIHDGLVAHKCTREKLHAVEAHPEIVARQLCGVVRCGDFRELYLGRKINGMAAFGKHVAGKENLGSWNFSGIDASAQSKGISRVRAEIPNSGEPPARQHLLHVSLE